MHILLLGASGTIGQAASSALATRGHTVTCILRPRAADPPGSVRRLNGNVADRTDLRAALRGLRIDALVSCLASRTGRPDDAWALDYAATLDAVHAARDAGAEHVVLLSALCVQKPRLPFQHAKRAAEDAVRASGLRYSIVRPTAYFKSLSGQIDRLRAGKPFMLFGNGRLTACKPISDRDLADYLAGCLTDPERWNRTLPIGGPGPALSPVEQGEMLFAVMNRPPKFRQVTPRLLSKVATGLDIAGRMSRRARDAADLARIGHYYATESMLVWDGSRYDAGATPETGQDTLRDHYARIVAEGTSSNLGDHAVFSRRRAR